LFITSIYKYIVVPCLLLVCMSVENASVAQNTSSYDSNDDGTRRTVTAHSKNGYQIELDGKLSDNIWDGVTFTSDFRQRKPDEGQKATETTEVAFVYDENALYIGARMYSENPSQIQAQLSRRDNIGNAERLIISLDTYLDRRTSRSFAITASSVRADYFQPQDEMSYRSRDYSFDPVWTAKSNIDSLGWTTEIRIPFSQLRYSDQKNQTWGLNINRYLPHKNEDDFWVMIPQDETGWASRFGLLTGIQDISSSKQIEFLPYTAGSALIKGAPDPKNPFNDDINLEGRFGGDIKISLGPNLKMDGTVNPDFGQVEADPAQVNLSAFETFFEEKRPFFTENQQIFQVLGGGGRSDRFFYSRRIGAEPSLDPSGDNIDYVDRASNTSILGASKITGRFPSGLSVGGLATVTAREKAEVYDLSSDTYDDVTVEPLTGYGVLRMQQEFGEYSSTVGGILTSVYRDLQSGSELSDILNKNALTGSADWNLRFKGGKYQISGDAGFSYISGSPKAMLRAQQSSARYYQRPDASYLSVDSTRTSLSGYQAGINLEKNAGKHWLWEVGGRLKSPGFELNDTGILFSADDISTQAELTYRENDPGSWYQSYRLEIGIDNSWNYGGLRKETGLQFSGDLEWKNFWSTNFFMQYQPRGMFDGRTRGGPLIGRPENMFLNAGISTNRSSKLFSRLNYRHWTDEFGGWMHNISGEFQYRSGERWELSLRPRFQMEKEKQQYLETLENGPAATFGKRYIFSTIERRTLSLRMRVNYAFNPKLTLELYAEPFVSSGNYSNPGELPSPGSYRLDRYNIDGRTQNGDYIANDGEEQFTVSDPDFVVHSFRSNLVLRYQWRPGSTFFLVWQQNRFVEDELSRFAEPGDLINTLNETGDNIISIKFTYWIPVN